jgi:hypothetical protein
MRLNYIATIFLMGFSLMSYAQTENALIPVYENNLWGFINAEGEYVIKPRFHSIGKFSSELAPVREDELYGYINTSGKFVIASQYDFALPFENGLGKVYIQGKPFFIDTKGTILFKHDFVEIQPFENRNVTFAFTKHGKYVLINKVGKMLMETTFESVSPFKDGLAIVRKASDDREELFYAIIDTEGKYVVDFGQYDRIENYANGYAKVWIYGKNYKEKDIEGIIDRKGELIFTIPEDGWSISLLRSDFTEGVGIVDLSNHNLPNQDWATRSTKMGIINEAGELIFNEDGVEEITYFHYNRAFIRQKGDKWSLIDKRGNIIQANLPGGLLENKTESDEKSLPFLNGIEILETPKGLLVIDTMGKALYPPRMFGRLVIEKRRENNILFYLEDVPAKEGHYVERWGFWDLEQNTVTKPKFERIFGFTSNHLIHVVKDNEECVVDRNGHTVWIQRVKENKILPLNIDYMLNGYIYVNSPQTRELNPLGGHGESGELPIMNTPKHRFPERNFSLIVKTNEQAIFENYISGRPTYIVNSTEDTIYFKAEDSRLEMVIEALNTEGKWKSIEHLPQAFCGHSFHLLYLPPNHHWSVTIPEYAGAFKTKLRVKLVYKKSKTQEETSVIYSNEFEGNINPAQFWRAKGSFDNMPKEEF